MRTTLTLDDDVASELERLRKKEDVPLKELVNQLLRAGLEQRRAPKRAGKRFHTRSVDLGTCLVPSLDNVAAVLAFAEGEDSK